MKTLLWLDDLRNPNGNCVDGNKTWVNTYSPIESPFSVIWAKSYKEFVYHITLNGLPDAICFDHDLADVSYNPETQQELVVWHEKTGMDCAKWLVDYCLDNDLPLPSYAIQSSNPAGKANIDGLFQSFIKQKRGTF